LKPVRVVQRADSVLRFLPWRAGLGFLGCRLGGAADGADQGGESVICLRSKQVLSAGVVAVLLRVYLKGVCEVDGVLDG
jgi:hypothetical protein